MKCKTLIDAESALAEAEDEVAEDMKLEAELEAQLSDVQDRISKRLEPAQEALAAAQDVQWSHLSEWVEEEPGRGRLDHTRRLLGLDGEPDLGYWNAAAWLRMMQHDDGVRRPTMDYQDRGGGFTANRTLSGDTVESLLAAADAVLREAGWTLDDAENRNEAADD